MFPKWSFFCFFQHMLINSVLQITYPWREIITSRPVLALCIGKFTYACGHTLFGTCFPLYIKGMFPNEYTVYPIMDFIFKTIFLAYWIDITETSVDTVGMLSGIPNIISIFAVPIAGHLVDYIQSNSGWSTTKVTYAIWKIIENDNARKEINTFSFLGS